MAYDKGLAERIRQVLRGRSDVEEKIMFGGICFMVSGHMCCGIVQDNLMARVGAEKYEQSLTKDHAREMDFTGRPMKGMIYVAPEGVSSDKDLENWISVCVDFTTSLPPKDSD
ncbi:MAG: TfoX/Sxy family protein [Balneolaceae bacterium]